MRKLKALLIFLFSITIFLFSQEKPTFYYETTLFKPGIHFEYLLRTLDTDNATNPTLKGYTVSIQADSEINEKITVSLWIGGIFSFYNDMVFRKIPISLKLTKDSGTIYGIMAGGGFDVKFAEYEDFNIGLFGKINYCFGIKKKWDITELAVSGEANGKSNWGRAYGGPKITYSAFETINPYAGIVIDYLFGKFNMDEKISTLEGSEGKDFHSKTLFGILVGTLINLTEAFQMEGGVIIYPVGENINIFGGLKYSF